MAGSTLRHDHAALQIASDNAATGDFPGSILLKDTRISAPILSNAANYTVTVQPSRGDDDGPVGPRRDAAGASGALRVHSGASRGASAPRRGLAPPPAPAGRRRPVDDRSKGSARGVHRVLADRGLAPTPSGITGGEHYDRPPATPRSRPLSSVVEHFHGKEGVVGSIPTEGSPAA